MQMLCLTRQKKLPQITHNLWRLYLVVPATRSAVLQEGLVLQPAKQWDRNGIWIRTVFAGPQL
jgi:hypothetical protein